MGKFFASENFEVLGKKVTVRYLFAPSHMYPKDREFRESDLKPEWKNFLAYLWQRKAPSQKTRDPQIYDALRNGGTMYFSTEFVHSDFHPMHLKSNEKLHGIEWLYELEKIGYNVVSPCSAIKND